LRLAQSLGSLRVISEIAVGLQKQQRRFDGNQAPEAGSAIPSLHGSGCGSGVNPRNIQQYINLSCFTAPAVANVLGNSGRNTLIGPGVAELDTSMLKTIHLPLSKESDLQFRTEAFNVLNRANFNPPSGAATQIYNQSLAAIPNAGAIVETSTTSRQIQFSLKLLW